jgi:hypothetical protein
MEAIYIDQSSQRATINREECVECYTCFNGMSQEHMNPRLVRGIRKLFKMARLRFDPEPDVCPTAAFEPDVLTWPRSVRRAFSDPRVPHESTGVEGRGTEEVKTNDVTGRVAEGEAGLTIEFGRPGIGVRMWEVQEMAQELARVGVTFETRNPVTSLMSDVSAGTLRDDVLGEKVLSAILEIKVRVERIAEILHVVDNMSKRVNTVVSVGVATRCGHDGKDDVVGPILERLGYNVARAKTNIGLGRATNAIHPRTDEELVTQ